MADSYLEVLQLTILVPPEDLAQVMGELSHNDIAPLEAETEGFDGTSVIELIVPLTTLAIPALVTLYKSRLAANRYISYKSNGIEIRGVDKATLLKLVELQARAEEKR